MFLHDKYAIHPLTNSVYYNPHMFFNIDIAKYLFELGHDDEIPNLLFYGNPGSGRHSLVNLLLYYIYGDEIFNITLEQYNINSNNNTKVPKYIKQSKYHMIYYPQNNNFDKYMIQNIIKTFISYNKINSNKHYKFIIINNVDKLSHGAQMSLRRTMEKESNLCRFIFISNSLSSVIDAIQSRITAIKVESPCNEDLLRCAINICNNEKKNYKISDLNNIIEMSQNNIKKMMLLLDMYFIKAPINNSYDSTINHIIDLINEKKFENTLEIKDIIYDLIITNIDSKKIIYDIHRGLIKQNDNLQFFTDINKITSKHNKLLSNSRRDIFMLNSFINNLIIYLNKQDL